MEGGSATAGLRGLRLGSFPVPKIVSWYERVPPGANPGANAGRRAGRPGQKTGFFPVLKGFSGLQFLFETV
jgi:hypothetical protein